MKYALTCCFTVLAAFVAFSQTSTVDFEKTNKGKVYFYWGWNWSGYSNSDISFKGADYDFTLKDVVAKDRPSKFSVNTYLNPGNATIPQYNFRVGYFFKKNWDISLGIDHMKYVMKQNQTAQISGQIENASTYEGIYENEDIVLSEDFLKFEHTDGLNYANIEVRHTDKIFETGKTVISLQEGLGAGILLPKTNTVLLEKERYDEFHLSGYGLGAVVGLNASFYDKFFIQTEFKGGFIDMPKIRTTGSTADKASQNFFFSQFNIVFGGIINTRKKAAMKSNQPKL